MKHEVFKTSEATAIQRGAMETETIQKNGASSKSLMSRRNFLVTLSGVLLAAGAVFSGCNKDKDDDLVSSPFDGTITATLEKGEGYDYFNPKVNKVSAVIWGEDYEEVELATGTYANGGFTITLPATPNAKFLNSLEMEDAPDGIIVSDKNAKVLMLNEESIIAYISVDYENELVCGKVDKNFITTVCFVYADRDFTITGSYKEVEKGYTYEEHDNVSLKKGWNRMYTTATETETSEKIEVTTKPVSGVKWYFEDDFHALRSAASGAKSKALKGSLKGLFSKK